MLFLLDENLPHDTYTATDLAHLLSYFLEGRDLQDLLGRITVVAPGRVRSRPLP